MKHPGKLRILLITPLFYPESYYLRGLPFAKGLVEQGFDVDVMTGFPNYPKGIIFPGYRQCHYKKEIVGGVNIHRFPAFISHDKSGGRRALTYLTQAISMALQSPFLLKTPDVVHVNQGPATLNIAAECLHFLRGCPMLLDVQDLWPESVMESGMLTSRITKNILGLWSKHNYRCAGHIITISSGIKEILVKRGVRSDKVSIVYNWCDEKLEKKLGPRGSVRDEHGLASGFNIIYAGNFGPFQALSVVLSAANSIKHSHPSIRFVLVGGGIEESELKRKAIQMSLNNVRFISHQPLERLNEIFSFADATLINLKDSNLNQVGVPSKLQHALAVGRPILFGGRGSSAELILQAEAGIVFKPQCANSMVSAVCALYSLPEEKRVSLGIQGRQFYMENMSFTLGIKRIAGIYRKLYEATQSQR